MHGMQSVWARCPLTAAFRLAEIGSVDELEWSVIRIELLRARPTQCYKCWHYGHVRSNCRSSQDRSGHCFGCGADDHSIRECRNLLPALFVGKMVFPLIIGWAL